MADRTPCGRRGRLGLRSIVARIPSKNRWTLVAVAIALALLGWRWAERPERGNASTRTEAAGPSTLEPREGVQHPRLGASAERSAVQSRERPATEAGGRVVLHVVDPGGKPVPGARVERRQAEREPWTSVGTTGPSGDLAVGPEEVGGRTLRAWTPGFLAAEEPVPSEPPGRIVLRLRRGRSLEGIVRWRDSGTSVGAGYQVLLFPHGSNPGPARARRALAGETGPDLLVGETDEEGRFSVQGVPPARRWYAIAGGPEGWNTKGWDVLEPGVIGDLSVDAVYAAVLEVRDADGGYPWIDPSMGPDVTIWSEREDIETAGASSSSPIYAFLPEECASLTRGNRRLYRPVLFARSARGLGGTVPLQVAVSIPGYENQSLQVLLPSIAEGCSHEVISLQRITDCWGELDLYLDENVTKPRGPREPRNGAVQARLWIRSLTGKRSLTYAVRHPCPTPLRIGPMPCDRYLVSLTMEQGPGHSLEPAEVEIVEGAVAEAALVTTPTGSIEVLIEDANGDPYPGGALVLVLRDGAGDMLAVDRSTRVLRGYTPGDYTVRVVELDGRAVGKENWTADVLVEAGKTARAVIRVLPP